MTVPEINHFAVLGLKPGASEDDIRQAYKTLARKYHPDKNGGDKKAEEKFKQVSSSYEFLQSKDRREMHERDLLNIYKKQPPKGNNSYFKTPNENEYFFNQQQKEQEKERERRKENRKKKQEDKRYGYEKQYKTNFPFGDYDEDFRSFFSQKDPFGKDFDPRKYFDEFMKPFKFGGIGTVDPQQLINEFMKPFMFHKISSIDFRNLFGDMTFGDSDSRTFFNEFMSPYPFETVERMLADFHPFPIERGSKGRDIEPWGIRFKVPSANFTSFYGGEDPFKDF